eukprot:4551022-Pyramimonas_sp.AAC.1
MDCAEPVSEIRGPGVLPPAIPSSTRAPTLELVAKILHVRRPPRVAVVLAVARHAPTSRSG